MASNPGLLVRCKGCGKIFEEKFSFWICETGEFICEECYDMDRDLRREHKMPELKVQRGMRRTSNFKQRDLSDEFPNWVTQSVKEDEGATTISIYRSNGKCLGTIKVEGDEK